jgi:hypothetical protein
LPPRDLGAGTFQELQEDRQIILHLNG